MPIEDHAYAVPSLLTEYASITLRTTTLTHAAQNQRILRILSFVQVLLHISLTLDLKSHRNQALVYMWDL
jgi:heme/copper-type cytochrome/quinol oxidase subunit 4